MAKIIAWKTDKLVDVDTTASLGYEQSLNLFKNPNER